MKSNESRLLMLFFVISLSVGILAGCGGGGGGGGLYYPIPVEQTGGINGYVYVPIGGARFEGTESAVGSMRAANAAPAGYKPLSGASVSCGGKSTTTNSNGYYSISGISVGAKTVTISKTGYQTITINVTIQVNVTVTVTSDGSTTGVLNPTDSGSLYITSTPSGALIYLDAENTSFTTPRSFTKVKTGEHQVSVELSGYFTPLSLTIDVQNGITHNVPFTLTPNTSLSVTATVYPNSGTTTDTYTLTCSVSGGTATSLEGRCDQSLSWIAISSGNTKTCSYSSAGYYRPGCRVNGTTTGDSLYNVNVTQSTSPSITASVYPTSGTTADTYTLTCTVPGGTASTLEGRCNTSDSWATIASGNTKSCTYTSDGAYIPGCRVNSTTTDNVDTAVTVSIPPSISVTASASPTSGNTSTVFTLTCSVSGGTATSLEGRCNTSNAWSTILSGNTKSCSYSSAGTYTPGCRVNGAIINNVNTAVTISELQTQANQVSIGGQHNCILLSSGAIKCFGYNNYGQLGNGTTSNSLTPVSVSGLSSGVSKISSGFDFTCALLSTGGVKCWGNNSSGQLGNGTITSSNTPVNVSGLSSGVVSISTGLHFTCALLSTGGVKCWGDNSSGQLGNETNTSSNIPVNVSGLSSGVVAITASGWYHACALLSTGGVKCWGYNYSGQLGNGTNTSSNIPVNVSGLSSGVNDIATGGSHSCAILSSGGIKCWGENFNGELGNGTNTSSNTPVSVSSLTSGVSYIVNGYAHTCALLSSGGVKCFGSNGFGELGNGTNTSSNIPVNVSGLTSGVVSISAGSNYECSACALLSTGGIKCWGSNSEGQLGNGTQNDSNIPVDVIGLY